MIVKYKGIVFKIADWQLQTYLQHTKLFSPIQTWFIMKYCTEKTLKICWMHNFVSSMEYNRYTNNACETVLEFAIRVLNAEIIHLPNTKYDEEHAIISEHNEFRNISVYIDGEWSRDKWHEKYEKELKFAKQLNEKYKELKLAL